MKTDEDRLYRKIGERIREKRTEAKLTQGQLADAVGLLRTSVTNIEAGRQKTPLHVLYDLCIELDVAVAEILPIGTEVMGTTTPSIEIGGLVKEVPPRSAEILQQMLREE
jgi:transcriptional regulator with XRE-family HTH domain